MRSFSPKAKKIDYSCTEFHMTGMAEQEQTSYFFHNNKKCSGLP